MWRWTSAEQVIQDLRFAFRQLRRNIGFTAFAVLTLALGIGANSAIFSVVNGVVLRPLPFDRPERLVDIWEAMPKRNIPRLPAPPGNYLDWRTMNHALASLGGFLETGFSVTSTQDPERYIGAFCDEGLFRTLQVAPGSGARCPTPSQGLVLTVIGLTGGLLAASVLTRFLETMLFGIGPADPATFLGVVCALLCVGMFACCLPALRAARVDPIEALREE